MSNMPSDPRALLIRANELLLIVPLVFHAPIVDVKLPSSKKSYDEIRGLDPMV
jgi:hypothetical protein